MLINLLLRPGWLDYNNTNIFSKSLFQPEYHILKKAFVEKLSLQTNREHEFPQDLKNINHIFDDHVGSDMTKEEFRQLCKTAWKNSTGLLSLILAVKKHNSKYRNGLDEFYIPN